ncbi:MAG: hypothetical protein K0R45_2594 [Pseudomonas sp.]|nr:hypothetical protein [Pseudomonas sp.]
MSSSRASVVAAALFAAACTTAFADQSDTQHGTYSRDPSASSQTRSAPANAADNAVQNNAVQNNTVRTPGRNASHSMHPGSSMTDGKGANSEVKALRQNDSAIIIQAGEN